MDSVGENRAGLLKLLIEMGPSVDKYCAIMDHVHQTNVARDSIFQRNYNGYYRVRQRTPEFYSAYYGFMELRKGSEVTFEETLWHLHEQLGRVEASFSSKLVATLNPERPIWDEYVLKNLGLKRPSFSCRDRLEQTVKLYDAIGQWYAEFLETGQAREIIELFDSVYPGRPITDLKKVDFVLWRTRA